MKKKNYKEALFWAIIIILVMFIISLDVIWLKTNPNPITKVAQEDSQQATYIEVYFDFNGGTGYTQSRSMSGTYNFAGINATRAGYTFMGWMYNGSVVGDGDALKSNSTHTLTAKWGKYITVTLDYNDGTGKTESATRLVPENGSYPYGSFFNGLPTPTRTGYTFDGWYYGSQKITDPSYSVRTLSDHTLTASWTFLGVQVSLDFNGGHMGTNYGPIGVTMYDTYNIPGFSLEKEGYTFGGWYYNG